MEYTIPVKCGAPVSLAKSGSSIWVSLFSETTYLRPPIWHFLFFKIDLRKRGTGWFQMSTPLSKRFTSVPGPNCPFSSVSVLRRQRWYAVWYQGPPGTTMRTLRFVYLVEKGDNCRITYDTIYLSHVVPHLPCFFSVHRRTRFAVQRCLSSTSQLTCQVAMLLFRSSVLITVLSTSNPLRWIVCRFRANRWSGMTQIQCGMQKISAMHLPVGLTITLLVKAWPQTSKHHTTDQIWKKVVQTTLVKRRSPT